MGELLKVLGFLLRLSRTMAHSRLVFSLIIVAGILSGLSNTGLLVLINTALNRRQSLGPAALLAFLALCLLLPSTRLLSRALLVHLSRSTLARLRVQLARQILATPLRRLETLGSHRLYAILTDDVGIITMAQAEIPLLFMHLTILFGSLVYLGWLSWTVLLALLAFIALGAFGYQWALFKAVLLFNRARETHNTLFHHFRSLTQGAKELKIHSQRREAFLARVEETAEKQRAFNFKADLIATAGDSWGHMLFFLVVGLTVLVLPEVRPVDQETLTGYTLVILHLITPLQVILTSLPAFGRAQVAIARVEEVGGSLAEPEPERQLPAAAAASGGWQRLELDGVTYAYPRGGQSESFTLGPVDLTLRPGEVVFLTGGNGSGKTTLGNLLVGLYTAEEGEILLDGNAVNDANRESYRSLFSAVFSEFFLFETLLGLPHLDTQAREYLSLLDLDHKVDVQEGQLSTVELSRGQRKRLALLVAYLEDRPIYVFDEWAADQDPEFKAFFYHRLLPDLKARGKTVLAITHDDRYFEVADRIVKLELGQIVGSSDAPGARVGDGRTAVAETAHHPA